MDQLDNLKKDIVNFFTNGDGKELNVSSIYVETMNKREPGQTSNLIEHILGVKYITEVVHGLKFRVGPVSFFQVKLLNINPSNIPLKRMVQILGKHCSR